MPHEHLSLSVEPANHHLELLLGHGHVEKGTSVREGTLGIAANAHDPTPAARDASKKVEEE